jgi:hypothetical protein
MKGMCDPYRTLIVKIRVIASGNSTVRSVFHRNFSMIQDEMDTEVLSALDMFTHCGSQFLKLLSEFFIPLRLGDAEAKISDHLVEWHRAPTALTA